MRSPGERWLPSTGNWQNFSATFRMRGRGVPSASEERCQKKARAPRVRALQRAYNFRQLLDSGEVNSRAEIARRYLISRARVTQVLDLLKLPNEILAHVAALEAAEQRWCTERRLRALSALPSRQAQLAAFEGLCSRRP